MSNAEPHESRGLRFLYHTALGRMVLKIAVCPALSRLCGVFLSSPLSRPLIPGFLKRGKIDLNDYTETRFRSFNDCFTRRIRPEKRPIDSDPDALIAPCDGLVSCYPITDGTVLPVKQSRYTIRDLLRNDALAERYRGGTCLVFRLCVNHYHRYCYPVDGVKGENHTIPGKLHTVRPIALAEVPVFVQNSRAYTVIQSERFGAVTQMEVGALLVGKIQNHHQAGPVTRGEEKGMFLYGGSTVILLLEAGTVEIRPEYGEATAQGRETPILQGQAVGHRK